MEDVGKPNVIPGHEQYYHLNSEVFFLWVNGDRYKDIGMSEAAFNCAGSEWSTQPGTSSPRFHTEVFG